VFFFKPSYYFISLVNNDKDISLLTQIVSNGKIESSHPYSQSFFGEQIPKKISKELIEYQEVNSYTYITTIIESKDQHIVKIIDTVSGSKDGHIRVHLNEDYAILIPETTKFEITHTFKDIGIDCMFSPFHIIVNRVYNTHVPTLVIFLHNRVSSLILEGKEIMFYETRDFVQMQEINSKEVNTFKNIHLNELKLIIENLIGSFYDSDDSNFVEKIVIMDSYRELNDNYIEKLKSEIMIDIEYVKMHLTYELNKLAIEEILG
jgi:hypothetical protein